MQACRCVLEFGVETVGTGANSGNLADDATGRVEDTQFVWMHLMLAKERAALDAPQTLPGPERGQQVLLAAGEPERGRGRTELIGCR